MNLFSLKITERRLFLKDEEDEALEHSECSFSQTYGGDSEYSGSVYFEKMRFLSPIKGESDSSSRILGEEELEIYDPSQDEETEEKNQIIEDIREGNWFWHFVGCATKETNQLFDQKADGVLGIMSLYEAFKYSKKDDVKEDVKKEVLEGPEAGGAERIESEGLGDDKEGGEEDKEEEILTVESENGRRDLYDELTRNLVKTKDSAPDHAKVSANNNLSTRRSRKLDTDPLKNINDTITKEISDLAMTFHEMEAHGRDYYESEQTPSLLSDLLTQGLVEDRKFSLCLGYSGGFLKIGSWNERSLRIMNFKHIEDELIKYTGAGSPFRRLSKAGHGEINSVLEKDKGLFGNFENGWRHREERLTGENDYESDIRDQEEIDKIQEVEDNGIKAMEGLAGVEIIRDRIQHIALQWAKEESSFRGGCLLGNRYT